MRASLLVLLLLGPALAGCISSSDPVEQNSLPTTFDLDSVEVPSAAELIETTEGALLRWTDVSLPLNEDIAIPPGVTMVRASADVGGDNGLFVQLNHADTGRRRCQVPYVESWSQSTVGQMSCAGLTAVDDLPTKWSLSVSSIVQTADLVEVQFITTPVDGLAGQLALDQLSLPTHEVAGTEELFVESFDGTRLYVEVTLPEGDGPWPVVISSSPYNQGDHDAGRVAMWDYFVHDWAKRGYAIVVADVRGFGASEGCVEVWSEAEQKDQAFLVDWAAEQDWSDGNVGFYGQSYLGTTAVAAAVQNPEALKAIIAVAPVNSAYEDWHFGGVPNGENTGSPISYQLLLGTAEPDVDPMDPYHTVLSAAGGMCDATLMAEANDPRAIYDAFYEERDFKLGASGVEAAVLYTQGFEDTNVKSAMIPGFFNELPGEKLGLFGHWVHQHPPRADQDVLFLAWMDQYVKGKDLGLEALPAADIIANDGTHRTAEVWPPADPEVRTLYAAFDDGALSGEPSDGTAAITVAPAVGTVPVPNPNEVITLETELAEPLRLAGQAGVAVDVHLENQENAHLAAFLYETTADGERTLVTWGMVNVAHRDDHTTYEPVAPLERVTVTMPLLPTEHQFREGSTVELELRAPDLDEWSPFNISPTEPGRVMFHGGEEGTRLLLPLAPADDVVEPTPLAGQH